jgi:hypothetical protein
MNASKVIWENNQIIQVSSSSSLPYFEIGGKIFDSVGQLT